MNMVLGAFVLTHISLLHVSMVAHMQDPYFEFHSYMDVQLDYGDSYSQLLIL